MSPPTIAGIATGSVVGLCVIAAMVWYLLRKRKAARAQKSSPTIYDELDSKRVFPLSEADSKGIVLECPGSYDRNKLVDKYFSLNESELLASEAFSKELEGSTAGHEVEGRGIIIRHGMHELP